MGQDPYLDSTNWPLSFRTRRPLLKAAGVENMSINCYFLSISRLDVGKSSATFDYRHFIDRVFSSFRRCFNRFSTVLFFVLIPLIQRSGDRFEESFDTFGGDISTKLFQEYFIIKNNSFSVNPWIIKFAYTMVSSVKLGKFLCFLISVFFGTAGRNLKRGKNFFLMSLSVVEIKNRSGRMVRGTGFLFPYVLRPFKISRMRFFCDQFQF